MKCLQDAGADGIFKFELIGENVVKYPGGKGGVYQRLINLMPPHETYIESHLGGGAVMRYKQPATCNIGIEIDNQIIEKWSRQPVDFELIHGDSIAFLKNYQFTGKELVYCDPPYLRETRKKFYPLYKYEYTLSQHEELLSLIKTLPCKVMISGYESSLYSETLESWNTYSFQAKTHHGMATEWLWMNYPTPTELHDYQYLGDNFRQREQIALKRARLVKKITSISILERQALFETVQSVVRDKETLAIA